MELGKICDDGVGVPENDIEAVEWYRKVAEQGHAPAQDNLGDMYAEGDGVPKNDAEAVKWYRKEAEQGLAWAQVSLGEMYAKGRGVRKNNIEAYAWANLAAAQGGYYADKGSELKTMLRPKMSKEQIAKEQARSLELHAEIASKSTDSQ